MTSPDTPRHIEIKDGDQTVAAAEVTTSSEAGGTARASLHAASGHVTPGRRANLVDAVMDLPEVQASARLEATVPLGDSESLERLRERTEDTATRPAGSTALVDADIPSGQPAGSRPGAGGERPARDITAIRSRRRHDVRRAAGLPAGSAAEQAAVVIRIGTSGWSYDHWHPELYAPGLAARDRLARYAAAFGTAELNSSFYRWPRPAAFSSWRHRLPDGFRLSVKAPRGLTHGRRLYAPETWLQRIAAGWHELGDKRAVLLVQLAPSHARDDARLGLFPPAGPGLDAGRGGVPASQLALRGNLRAAGSAWCRLLRDERRGPAVHTASHHRFCLRADARPGSSSPVRRFLPRRRPDVVG